MKNIGNDHRSLFNGNHFSSYVSAVFLCMRIGKQVLLIINYAIPVLPHDPHD